jgi:NAD(P)-dependent dehydrogenase (short-subunit alcohol dehydrogenase family)
MRKPLAIVTGASSGIGLELAAICAQEGLVKDDPADVARVGFDAMMRGDGDVVSGWKNKLQSAIANVTPAGVLAEQHRRMAEPGSAKKAES